MKLATLRRRGEPPPGVSGVARLDRRTNRLAGRVNPGDIAIIDHVDLDRVAAEALVAARVAAVINAQPSISGRYPNLGPDLIVESGIPLLDNVGSEIFAAVKEGMKIRIDGESVYVGETVVATGTAQTPDSVAAMMAEAKVGLSAQLEAFAVNTSEFMSRERELLLDGVGVPAVRTKFAGKHVLVVVRGYGHAAELKSLKHYIREFKPVLVGVDGGADVLLAAGHKPHLIVGDMDAVSDAALATGAEVVVHAYPDGRAPGLLRVQDLGIEPVSFPTSGTSEDIAMLLADDNGAELIVAVGTHATLTEFLDQGRSGMASTFLTRL
ncbi:MAG TPA: putative cytokinetic ring protein SteA, partial [Actinospica sp.]|nr:putative cytokinetic ring protein SteA [Actinospica sp.]